MHPKPVRLIPGLVAMGVILLVSIASCLRSDFFERLERMTFDMRVREALRFGPTVATNLGFLYFDEETIRRVRNGSLGYRFSLYWPRQVYGRVVEELADQGAKTVAFDVVFGELRPSDPPVQMADGNLIESDQFFAIQMRQAGGVIIPAAEELTLPPLFVTNAYALGDIVADKDRGDGILRRAKAFRLYRDWHPVFRQMEADPELGIDLHKAQVQERQIVFPRYGAEAITVPLDADGNFDLATDFLGTNIPVGWQPKAKPFKSERIWHMGVVLAARELGLDLTKAEIDLPHGRITLLGPGIERVIPVDQDGWFYIDWCLPPNHRALTRQSLHDLLAQNRRRLQGQTNDLQNLWAGKSVVVGSSAVGNDLTDRGATPLEPDTLLVSKHWNIANSIITGRFIRRAPLAAELGLIALLGTVAAIVTWQLRALPALGVVILVASAYITLAILVYVRQRYWLPIVLPVLGALMVQYLCQVTWRVVFEQAERRRVRSVFSTMVSPKIVNELLQAETLELGGVRREITVFFADVRGFTNLTDASQERAAEFVRQNKLAGVEAEAAFDDHARETLATVNVYLGLIADTVIQHDGTLDKFIGDCVMAFWGAPTPNPCHALFCVRAAVQAQRAIHKLNCERKAENQKRASENVARVAAGLPALDMLPTLLLGTGINTGVATVGLMGSAAQAVVRQGSYTVFGHEVNVASRLEGHSGGGHIYVSESTYQHLCRDDPALASSCVSLPPLSVKGIHGTVKIYEIPWRMDGPPSMEGFALPENQAATSAGPDGQSKNV